MKYSLRCLLVLNLFLNYQASGLSLSQIVSFRNNLKDTIDFSTGKLKERKLSVVRQRQTDTGLTNLSRSSEHVDRYLKPTKPRQLIDSAKAILPSKSSSTNTLSVESNKTNKDGGSKLSTSPLGQNSTSKVSELRKLNKAERLAQSKSHRTKKVAKKAFIKKGKAQLKKKGAKKVIKKAAAKKGKHAIKIKISRKKNVVKHKKAAKQMHHAAKKASRDLVGGLNNSDNKLLEELSKKVQALKEQKKEQTPQTQPEKTATNEKALISTPASTILPISTPIPAQRKLKSAQKKERKLRDYPSQNEFYSNMLDESNPKY